MEVHLLNTTSDSQPLSNKPGHKAVLASQHWVVTDNETARKVKYIFRPNGDLLITQIKAGKGSN